MNDGPSARPAGHLGSLLEMLAQILRRQRLDHSLCSPHCLLGRLCLPDRFLADLELSTPYKVDSIYLIWTLLISYLVATENLLLKEVQHSLYFLFREGLKDPEALEELNFFLKLPPQSIADDDLVVSLVESCKVGLILADGRGRSRLISHQGQFAKGGPRSQPRHLFEMRNLDGTRPFGLIHSSSSSSPD